MRQGLPVRPPGRKVRADLREITFTSRVRTQHRGRLRHPGSDLLRAGRLPALPLVPASRRRGARVAAGAGLPGRRVRGDGNYRASGRAPHGLAQHLMTRASQPPPIRGGCRALPEPARCRPPWRSLSVKHGEMLGKPSEQHVPALITGRAWRLFEQPPTSPSWLLVVLLQELCLCTNMWMTCAQRRRACAYAVEMLGIPMPGRNHNRAFTWDSMSRILCMQRKPELSTCHAAISNK